MGDSHDDHDQRLHTYVRGLENPKNACFANSVFQGLSAVPPFLRFVKQHGQQSSDEPLVRDLLRLLDELSESSTSSLGHLGSQHVLINCLTGLGNGAQQDAHEFMQFVQQRLDLSEADAGNSFWKRAALSDPRASLRLLSDYKKQHHHQQSEGAAKARPATSSLLAYARARSSPLELRWAALRNRLHQVGDAMRQSLANDADRSSSYFAATAANDCSSSTTSMLCSLMGVNMSGSTLRSIADMREAGNPFSFCVGERVMCNYCHRHKWGQYAPDPARVPPQRYDAILGRKPLPPFRGNPGNILSIEPSHVTLERILCDEFGSTQLPGDYRCEGCVADSGPALDSDLIDINRFPRVCRKFRRLLTLPPALCIHINRMSFPGHKQSNFVRFNLTLDMRQFSVFHVGSAKKPTAATGFSTGSETGMPTSSASSVAFDTLPPNSRNRGIYTLVAVVKHLGGGVGGHYVTYRRVRPPPPPRQASPQQTQQQSILASNMTSLASGMGASAIGGMRCSYVTSSGATSIASAAMGGSTMGSGYGGPASSNTNTSCSPQLAGAAAVPSAGRIVNDSSADHTSSNAAEGDGDDDALEAVRAEAEGANWVCANDDWVSPVDVEEVLRQEAYMLFYVRV